VARGSYFERFATESHRFVPAPLHQAPQSDALFVT
jgi:hypothetical protein